MGDPGPELTANCHLLAKVLAVVISRISPWGFSRLRQSIPDLDCAIPRTSNVKLVHRGKRFHIPQIARLSYNDSHYGRSQLRFAEMFEMFESRNYKRKWWNSKASAAYANLSLSIRISTSFHRPHLCFSYQLSYTCWPHACTSWLGDASFGIQERIVRVMLADTSTSLLLGILQNESQAL